MEQAERTSGYTEEQIATTLAIQDALAENAVDFAAFIKIRGVRAHSPEYSTAAREFGLAMIRNESMRRSLVR